MQKILAAKKKNQLLLNIFLKKVLKIQKWEALSEGTRIQIRKSNIIIKFTQPWPPPNS